MYALFVLTLLPLLPLILSLNNDEMRARTVYQIVTDRYALSNDTGSGPSCDPAARQYCGGTWAGIADRLDHVQGLGFDTIWISPIVQNIGGSTGDGEAYHGYWSLDVEKLNDHFGTAADLTNLVSAVHAKGMYIMVDVVVNHVGATSGSSFTPSADYGPFSSPDDFHPYCMVEDYANQTNVEQCWLGDTNVSLSDLNTESPKVSSYWNTWITQLVSNYSLDAIRIDTVKHVPHTFWPGFTSAAGVFNQGEVLQETAAYVGSYQSNGSVNPFNYPVYYDLVKAFGSSSGDLAQLVNQTNLVKGNFTDPTLAGMFLNNHDNPRFESYTNDTALIKNAHAYAMVGDGIPYLYYGSEAGFNGGNDPANREPLWTTGYNTTSSMYAFFASLNAARRAAGNASSSFYTSQMNISTLGSSELLIAKTPLISLLSNRGASSSSTSNVTIPSSSSGWTAEIDIIDALSCSSFTTDGSGNLAVGIEGGMPRVLIESSKKGALCPQTATTAGSQSAAGRLGVSRMAILIAGLVVLLFM